MVDLLCSLHEEIACKKYVRTYTYSELGNESKVAKPASTIFDSCSAFKTKVDWFVASVYESAPGTFRSVFSSAVFATH